MKAIENPITRVFTKECNSLVYVYLEIDMKDDRQHGYNDAPKGHYRLQVDSFNRMDKDRIDALVNKLQEMFGIHVKIIKSKIKPVTFAEMVIEE